MIKIYGRNDSSNVQAVMWCVGELDLPHERLDRGHRFGGTDSAEYLAMNPNGLVPVLVDGSHPAVFESAAILRYLASAYGRDPFWPAAAAERAQIDKWAEWCKTTLAPRFTVPIFWAKVRTAPSQQIPEKIEAAINAFDEKLRIAENQLSQHDWLAGEEFTLADIQLGHLLYRYFDMDIVRQPYPALRAYYDKLCERPAYKHHVMISYDALRVTD